MPTRRTRCVVMLLVATCLLLVGCDEEQAPASSAPCGSDSEIEFEMGQALLDGGETSTFIDVEIADSDRERQVGLMNRESLPEDCGMAFLYFEEITGGFWMKDTLIPLSIAFFDKEGVVVGVLDMEPCEEDPCETYSPGVPFVGALEVNQGAFEKWGIEEGDRISIIPPGTE